MNVYALVNNNGRPVANHIVTENAGTKTLTSFVSKVARIDPDGSVTLGPDSAVSATTRKYVALFLGDTLPQVRAKVASGEYTKAPIA